ncbi:MAG: hypothetical protein K0Q59_3424, partial [Paenibacillus sp.]|nr:hypothetical protein [Paenibacillus sp.]
CFPLGSPAAALSPPELPHAVQIAMIDNASPIFLPFCRHLLIQIPLNDFQYEKGSPMPRVIDLSFR